MYKGLCGKQLIRAHNTGLAQDCSNSSALAMELLQSYAKPSLGSVCLLLCPANSFHNRLMLHYVVVSQEVIDTET